MKVDFFEGGRRLLKVIEVMIALAAIWIWAVSTTNYTMYYNKYAPVGSWFKTGSSECVIGTDAIEFITRKYEDEEINLNLCFHTEDFSGNKLIPYKMDKDTGTVWGDGPYTANVTEYTAKEANNFVIPAKDAEFLFLKTMWAKFKNLIKMIGGTALVLVACEAIGWSIGWVVRGFVKTDLPSISQV